MEYDVGRCSVEGSVSADTAVVSAVEELFALLSVVLGRLAAGVSTIERRSSSSAASGACSMRGLVGAFKPSVCQGLSDMIS